ncbi:MAG: hypothetical protein EOO15_08605 [Chitinophagaceae bacterium]|nr:MAG: hypothetical protein EOO15_08605 [Chitinophagaceae bacterium]
MELHCPDCGQAIPAHHINIAADLARCSHCGALHRASDLMQPVSPGAPVSSQPPAGSSLEVSRELDGVQIHLPRRKAGCGTFFFAGFALFWLSFVAVWTYFAAQGSSLFALFSIPFWFVGGGLLLASINSVSETQTITVSRKGLTIVKKRLMFSKRHEFDFRAIEAIRLAPMRSNSFNAPAMARLSTANGAQPQVPAVINGDGNVYFFESANTAEQEWAVGYLSSKMTERS